MHVTWWMPSSFMRRTLLRAQSRPYGSPSLLPVDGALQLRLVHPRAAFDAELLRLVVELVARAALRAVRARALSPALARRLVADGRARARARLAPTRALLVDRARGDLLRGVLGLALALDALLDVLVLTGTLCPFFHSTWWHDYSVPGRVRCSTSCASER